MTDFSLSISLGEAAYDLVSGARAWNRWGRVAMEHVLRWHHEHTIPQHFRLGAAEKYHYAPRLARTKAIKVRRWKLPGDLNLVRTQQSAYSIRSHARVTMRGAFGGENGLEGRLHMRLPHPVRRDQRIGHEQIRREIVAMTPEEQRQMALRYRAKLIEGLLQRVGPMRFWKRYGAKTPYSAPD